jgi:hypothetical protein
MVGRFLTMSLGTDQSGNEVHIRPAEVGDICVLLEPVQAVEIDRFRQHQKSLQSSFGGSPIERIHHTCQRFADPGEGQLKIFEEILNTMLAGMAPFSLTAVSLHTLYLPVRQTNILKWGIEVTDALRQFAAVVEQAVVSAGMAPLYRPGFVSSLLAALKEVPELDENSLAEFRGFPYHLYTVEQIILSRICGPNAFKTLAIFPLLSSIE